MVCNSPVRVSFGRSLRALFCFALLANMADWAHAQDIEWQQASGSYQGSVQCVGFAQNGTIFTGTEGDGIFRSTNNGVSWLQINSGITNRYISSLVFPSSGTIFASAYLYSGGLFRSTDNGATWFSAAPGLTEPFVTSLAVSSRSLLLAGTKDSGVFLSTDDGLNWGRASGGLPMQAILSLTADSAGTIYAGTVESGVYRTVDSGKSWQRTASPATAIYSLTPGSDRHIFAATSTEILVSSDQGVTWQTSLSVGSAVYSLTSAKDSNGLVTTLFAGTQNSGVYISTDNGASWQQSLNGLASTFINDIAVERTAATTNGYKLIAGTLYGVYLSDDTGHSWHSVNTALQNPSILALATLQNGSVLAGTNGGGISISTDRGESWYSERGNLVDSIITSLTLTKSGAILASTLRDPMVKSSFDGLYRSSDDGTTWNRIAASLIDSGARQILQSQAGTLFAATPDHGLIVSTDDGLTWDLTPTATGYSYACDSIGEILSARASGLYVSTNEGNSWVFSHSLPTTGSLEVTHRGTFLLGRYRSTNHGSSWTSSNRSSDSSAMVFCSPTTSNGRGGQEFINMVGADAHVAISNDDGQSYTLFDGGLTSHLDPSKSVLITSFSMTPDGYLFVGSAEGVYHTTLPVADYASVFESTIDQFSSTLTNFPNPFRGTTSLVYNLSQDAFVHLDICDITGRIVERLRNGRESQGRHTALFDGTDLPAGLYFARLSIPGMSISESVLLIK